MTTHQIAARLHVPTPTVNGERATLQLGTILLVVAFRWVLCCIVRARAREEGIRLRSYSERGNRYCFLARPQRVFSIIIIWNGYIAVCVCVCLFWSCVLWATTGLCTLYNIQSLYNRKLFRLYGCCTCHSSPLFLSLLYEL